MAGGEGVKRSALRLYERCGFAMSRDAVPAYYDHPIEDAVLMRCRISYVHGDAPV